MSSQHASGIKAQFEAFSRSAILDVYLPKALDLDAASLIRDGSPEDIPRAPSRRNVFFDEIASLSVIVRVVTPEDEVRSILPSLELTLTTYATDTATHNHHGAGKHQLGHDVVLCGRSAEIVPLEGYTFLIFKSELPLQRPRLRLQRPSIYFTASFAVRPDILRDLGKSKNDFLKSFDPLPANVLEPLQFDPALRESNVFLPENRITKVAPKTPDEQDTLKPIRGATKRAFPAVPALFTRMTFSSLSGAIIASLHLQTSSAIAGFVSINSSEIDAEDVHVEDLTGMNFPLKTQAGDEIVLLYKLASRTRAKDLSDRQSATLSISIKATAVLDQGSRVNLETKWRSQIDLAPALAKSVYQWSARPVSTSTQGDQRSAQFKAQDSSRKPPRQLDSLEAGILFSFTAPAMTHKNKDFEMDVRCTNRSNRSRRFKILRVQPQLPNSVSEMQSTATDPDWTKRVFQGSPVEISKTVDVLNLSPSVEVAPLPAGDTFETSMPFRAVKSGALDLGILRIIDLDTRQTIDVEELPDVVALEPAN